MILFFEKNVIFVMLKNIYKCQRLPVADYNPSPNVTFKAFAILLQSLQHHLLLSVLLPKLKQNRATHITRYIWCFVLAYDPLYLPVFHSSN